MDGIAGISKHSYILYRTTWYILLSRQALAAITHPVGDNFVFLEDSAPANREHDAAKISLLYLS